VQIYLIPPKWVEPSRPELGNPCDVALVLVPVGVDTQVQGVVELVLAPEASLGFEAGPSQVVAQGCASVNDYLRARQQQQQAEQQRLWKGFAPFARQVHDGLDLRGAAYRLANEGRQFLECDRVTVAVRKGRKCRVEAISGQDVINWRSNIVRRLNDLATRVAAAGEPLWHGEDGVELPRQLHDALQAYLDESHARMVAVLPLVLPEETGSAAQKAAKNGRPRRRQAVGALVVEQFKSPSAGEDLRRRAELATEHAALALNNSLTYNRLFLLPLWRALGKASWLVQSRTLPKTILAVAAVAAAVAALVLVPADFELEARGRLEPKVRREVYARMDGIVEAAVPAEHGKSVEEGEVLAVLRNPEHEAQVKRLEGERLIAGTRLASTRASLLTVNQQTPEGRARHTQLAAEAEQLATQQRNLDEQYELLKRLDEDHLKAKSPIAGQIITWDVEKLLANRPVQRGQALLTVADISGPWVLEVLLADRRAGHVRLARDTIRPDLDVEFILATDPAITYRGRIEKMALSAQVDEEQGSSVLVTVAIDRSQLKELRPGATVVAKINCGRQAIGYVWLHDVFEFVQSRVLFRL
jgi:hypothetical protein